MTDGAPGIGVTPGPAAAHAAVALERAPQDDRSLVDEVVHEPRVVVPAVLLPHVAAPVPGPAALEPQDDPDPQDPGTGTVTMPASTKDICRCKCNDGAGLCAVPEPGNQACPDWNYDYSEISNAGVCSLKNNIACSGYRYGISGEGKLKDCHIVSVPQK